MAIRVQHAFDIIEDYQKCRLKTSWRLHNAKKAKNKTYFSREWAYGCLCLTIQRSPCCNWLAIVVLSVGERKSPYGWLLKEFQRLDRDPFSPESKWWGLMYVCPSHSLSSWLCLVCRCSNCDVGMDGRLKWNIKKTSQPSICDEQKSHNEYW